MFLKADDVTHGFPGRPPLFQNLTLQFDPGSLIGLVGPSGSGKSTLLSLLGGFARPNQGKIVKDGIATMGWVFQRPVGSARRTALDIVAYPMFARGWPQAEARDESLALLSKFGLTGRQNTEFRHLSGGEGQRVMLARAVASRRDVLLIDEPTAQLDPQSARTVIDVIGEVISDEVITIVATHDARLIEECTQIIDLGNR